MRETVREQCTDSTPFFDSPGSDSLEFQRDIAVRLVHDLSGARVAQAYLGGAVWMTEKCDATVPLIYEMTGCKFAAFKVINDYGPYVTIITDAVHKNHRNAAILEHLEPRAVFVNGGDDDALDSLLHE